MLTIEVHIKEQIKAEWSQWFKGFCVEKTENAGSTIRGQVQDQSALYGLLAKLRDLGLTLIDIRTSPAGEDSQMKI